MDTVKISLRITEELLEAVNDLAKRYGVSRSAIIKIILSEYVENGTARSSIITE